MFIEKIAVPIFEKGDYVRTGDGVGIVLDIHFMYREFNKIETLWYYEVKVQHKSGLSSNPSNSPKDVDYQNVFLITKTEYDYDE